MRSLLLAAAASALVAGAATAQSLADRIARVPNGTVRFSYAARPGVCGNGDNIQVRSSRDDDWEYDCEPGPVRVSLRVVDRTIIRVKAHVGGRWRTGLDPAADLGMVPSREAARLFLSLAERSDSKVGEEAIFPATLADSVEVWPDLIRLARSASLPQKTRRSAIFWLGQAAGEAATRGLDSLATDVRQDREVRKSAVFALSQRPHGEGVPALIRAARTDRDPEIRKSALFWLGQSDDPRALALFEELLTAH